MKKDSFWDNLINYLKIKTIIPAIILLLLAIVLIAKVLFNKIIG